MASVEKRVRSGRTAWVARWRDPSGRTLTRSFVKRSEADDYLDGIRHSLRSGASTPPPGASRSGSGLSGGSPHKVT